MKTETSLRFFKVTLNNQWIETDLGYKHGVSHKEIANTLPIPSKRVHWERFREIEQTGIYYRISEMCKNGKAFIFEVMPLNENIKTTFHP